MVKALVHKKHIGELLVLPMVDEVAVQLEESADPDLANSRSVQEIPINCQIIE